MTKALTVEDVILGEAKAGSFQDMVAIASVIENRARSLGTSYDDVVANRKEFNAYGKSLPKGATQYRDLARQAIEYVKTNGPVHNATFYATPKASKNLPDGLQKVASTDGHAYYADPEYRAINTASGYKRPDPQLASITRVPTPSPRPGSAAASDLPTFDEAMAARQQVAAAPVPEGRVPVMQSILDGASRMAGVEPRGILDFSPPRGAIRNQPIQPELASIVSGAVSRMGPEYGWDTVSGGQPARGIAGITRTGSTRHNDGFAVDGALTLNGERLDPVNNYQDYMNVMTNLAEEGAGGLGHYGWGIHADVRAPNAWGPNTRSSSLDPGFAAAIQQGRALSGLNRQYPTPSPRPGTAQADQATGIMSIIDPPTQTAVQRSDLAAPRSILDEMPRPQTIMNADRQMEVAGQPVKGGRVGSGPSSFDSARFGTTAAPVDTFDNARFGDTVPMNYDRIAAAKTPTAPADFDSARFGTATTNPDGIDGLRAGLTAQKQQLSQPRSILDSAQAAEMPAQSQGPSMSSLADQYAQYGVGQAAMRDVSQQIGLAQDVADYRAAQGLPPLDQPFTNIPTSPPSPAATAIDAASPVSALGGAPAPVEYSTAGISLDAITDAANRAKTANSLLDEAQERRRKNMMMGGILGGAMLGPVGGILGLLGANAISNNSAQAKAAGYYPTAPSILGAVRQFMGRDPGGPSYKDLNERGRDTYRDSGQFKDAIDQKQSGLY